MKYKKIKQNYPEIGGALLCIMLGTISGLGINVKDSLWFINLQKPSFMPPNWIFGPVWTILYFLMGIALAKLWKERAHPTAAPRPSPPPAASPAAAAPSGAGDHPRPPPARAAP